MNETDDYGTSGAARTIGEEVKAGAREAVEAGKERTRSFLDEQRSAMAEQMEDVAAALRRTAREHDGRGSTARLVDRAADGVERLAESLQQRDLRGLLSGCEDFARRSPAVFVGSALTAGFLLTRFLKSSRERRERTEHTEHMHTGDFGAGTGFGEDYPPRSETTTTSSPAGRAY